MTDREGMEMLVVSLRHATYGFRVIRTERQYI